MNKILFVLLVCVALAGSAAFAFRGRLDGPQTVDVVTQTDVVASVVIAKAAQEAADRAAKAADEAREIGQSIEDSERIAQDHAESLRILSHRIAALESQITSLKESRREAPPG